MKLVDADFIREGIREIAGRHADDKQYVGMCKCFIDILDVAPEIEAIPVDCLEMAASDLMGEVELSSIAFLVALVQAWREAKKSDSSQAME